MAQALYSAGYRYVGRYLTGTVGGTRSKALTEKEANIIFAAGLKIFAIFQTGAAYLGRYTYEKGVRDGLEAIEAADMLGIPYNEIIYFAVDYDLQGAEIQSNAVPYFSGIKKSFQQHPGKYRIGVYGTRNTCSKITEAGHAVSSFVADMSTGFSGNMGFKIPSNWAFDQFAEITFSYSGGTIGIDKDGYSGRYSGFDKLEKHPDPVMSEEVRKALSERGAFIIESIGVLGISDFTVSQVYKYNIQLSEGIWEVEYGTTVNTKVLIIDTVKSATVDVKDGKFNENLIADMMSVLHITCGGNEESINLQMKMLTEIAGKITNGKVKVGVSVDIVTKKITFSYQVEETYNYNDELTCTLTTYVKLSIKSDDNFMQEFQRALEAVDVYAYNELRVTLGITAVILFLFELFYFLPAV